MVLNLSKNTINSQDNIFVIITTSLVIILGIANFITLFKKRKQIPFSNVSPVYLLFTFSGKLTFLFIIIVYF